MGNCLTSLIQLLRVDYPYNRYGFTSSSGGSANSYQYLGRETDATGLYEFRNRYYNPITERFLSEDPIGLAGGPNLYEYGADNPTTFRDPSGKIMGEGCALGVAAYGLGQIAQGLFGRKMDRGWKAAGGIAMACALGEATEGIGPAFEAIDGMFGAVADGMEGLGPDALQAEQGVVPFEAPPASQPKIYVIGRQQDVADFIAANGTDGYNYLSVPDEDWSMELNNQWVQQGVDEGAQFQIASQLSSDNTFTGGAYNEGFSVFGVELGKLFNAGYTLPLGTDVLIPPAL